MKTEIKCIFKDEYFAYHAKIDETGITLFATNRHGERVSEKWLNTNHLKELLDHGSNPT